MYKDIHILYLDIYTEEIIKCFRDLCDISETAPLPAKKYLTEGPDSNYIFLIILLLI